MNNLKEGNLDITINTDKGNTVISWIGKSDDRDPSSILNPYFSGLIPQLKGKPVIIDFVKLEYMNSSTVPPIISFIKDLESNSINSKIFYDKNSKWQSASFKALETIAKTFQFISVEGK